MIIVIKVGTQAIFAYDGTPLINIISDLVSQISILKQKDYKIVLVSSGAVSYGRKVARDIIGVEYTDSHRDKQTLASLGQPAMMNIYLNMFSKYNLAAAQMLVTKLDFFKREEYLNISEFLNNILQNPLLIPIVNENDATALSNNMFTDNDELAGLIASQVKADKLIIFSNVEGVFNGDPDDEDKKIIKIINPSIGWPEISNEKSNHGRGGMQSKLNIAKRMSDIGITTHITNLSEENILLKIIHGEDKGTKVLPIISDSHKNEVDTWEIYKKWKEPK